MIELFGPTQTAEFDAARELKRLLLDWHPSIATNAKVRATILVKEKLQGKLLHELDLILLLVTDDSRHLPTIHIDGQQTGVESLVLSIEVKDKDADGIQFRGNRVLAASGSQWDDVTEQVHGQTYALKACARQRIAAADAYTAGIGWLRGVAHESIPTACAQFVGSGAAFDDFVRAAAADGLPRHVVNGRPVLRAVGHDAWKQVQAFATSFTKVVRPSRLDRRRLEAISKSWLDDQKYVAQLGTIMLLINGAPGTGKTLALLRIARDLVKEHGARVLFLTYNHALIAEVKRLIGHNPDLFLLADGRSGLRFSTVDAFMWEVGRAVGVEEPSDGSYAIKYAAIKAGIRTVLSGRDTLLSQSIIEAAPKKLDVDYVMVDEGQDGPDDERDAVRNLFGHKKLIVAIGKEQLQRRSHQVQWKEGLPRTEYRDINLTKVRRLSASLFRFAQAFLIQAGAAMEDEVSCDGALAGGTVHVVDGDYFASKVLHDGLVAGLATDENAPIDMLFAVPPGEMVKDAAGVLRSRAAVALQQWGHAVWDGTEREVRSKSAESTEQIRIVNYQSIRGLEGWTVCLLGFDRYYRWLLDHVDDLVEQNDLLISKQERAALYASHQLIIPMTRAVSNLVIEINDQSSPVYKWLKELHSRMPDTVNWHMRQGI